MENQWNELEEEEITMLNGHCVINALASEKREITEDELLEYFIESTDVLSHNLVQRELNRILAVGVANGFISKNSNKYKLPSLENIYVADADEDTSADETPIYASTPRNPSNRNRLRFVRPRDERLSSVLPPAPSPARAPSAPRSTRSTRSSTAQRRISSAATSSRTPQSSRGNSRKRKISSSRMTPAKKAKNEKSPPKAKQPKGRRNIQQPAPRRSGRQTRKTQRYAD